MKRQKSLAILMNVIIILAIIQGFKDPELNKVFTKVSLILAALFLAYKIFKK